MADKLQEIVTITQQEYDRLYEVDTFMYCLEAAGVDNWDGYDFAKEILEDQE